LTSGATDTAVRFGIDSKGVNASARTWADADHDIRDLAQVKDPTIGTASDGKAAWAATVSRRAMQCHGLSGTFDQCKSFEDPPVNVLALFDKLGKKWNPIAVHSAVPVTAKDQAKQVADGAKLAAIPNAIDASAQGAVTAFKAGLADPKALAASVSKRADAVLFGSAPKEKFVGGARVAATLAKWNLTFTIRDGITAGTTSSKTVAWVAANVDARPAGKSAASATPYRLMCIYELDKANAWKLVAIAFSFPTNA